MIAIEHLSTLFPIKAVLARPSSSNQRAYADMIEERACELAQMVYPAEFRSAQSVRSIEDFAILHHGRRYLVDVKTRQLTTDFNMPNLISVDRLHRLLADDGDLYYWFIDYSVVENNNARIDNSVVRPVWDLPWAALSIQNLGLGQLQISDFKALESSSGLTKTQWHAELQTAMREFYTRQSRKFLELAESV